jgi:hypothetical protein
MLWTIFQFGTMFAESGARARRIEAASRLADAKFGGSP